METNPAFEKLYPMIMEFVKSDTLQRYFHWKMGFPNGTKQQCRGMMNQALDEAFTKVKKYVPKEHQADYNFPDFEVRVIKDVYPTLEKYLS
jgi:hypothetical protein